MKIILHHKQGSRKKNDNNNRTVSQKILSQYDINDLSVTTICYNRVN